MESTEQLKQDVIKIIEEQNRSDIKNALFGRSCYKITGDVTETVAHILIGICSLISFAAASWQVLWYLSFIGGCFGVASICLLKFSSFSMRESKERTLIINKILDRMGIDPIVDISFDSTIQDVNTIVKGLQNNSI